MSFWSRSGSLAEPFGVLRGRGDGDALAGAAQDPGGDVGSVFCCHVFVSGSRLRVIVPLRH
jgi:hypothetical protein